MSKFQLLFSRYYKSLRYKAVGPTDFLDSVVLKFAQNEHLIKQCTKIIYANDHHCQIIHLISVSIFSFAFLKTSTCSCPTFFYQNQIAT